MRLFSLIWMVLCICLISGCSKNEENSGPIRLSDDSQQEQTYYSNEQDGNLSFTANDDWSAIVRKIEAKSSDVDWVHLSQYSGSAGTYSLTLTLDPNTTGYRRAAEIIISCGDMELVINITQKGITQEEEENGEEDLDGEIVTPGDERPTRYVSRIEYDGPEGSGTIEYTYDEDNFPITLKDGEQEVNYIVDRGPSYTNLRIFGNEATDTARWELRVHYWDDASRTGTTAVLMYNGTEEMSGHYKLEFTRGILEWVYFLDGISYRDECSIWNYKPKFLEPDKDLEDIPQLNYDKLVLYSEIQGATVTYTKHFNCNYTTGEKLSNVDPNVLVMMCAKERCAVSCEPCYRYLQLAGLTGLPTAYLIEQIAGEASGPNGQEIPATSATYELDDEGYVTGITCKTGDRTVTYSIYY